MLRNRLYLWITLTTVLIILSACLPEAAIPSQEEIEVAAQQTVAVQMTRAAFETLVAELTQVALATATPTPTPTETQPPPAKTPDPTATATATVTPLPPTAIATSIPCFSVQFITDVTIPDGTTFSPNETFTKTWRVRNSGSCTWTTDFDLVFMSGSLLGASKAVDLPHAVTPNNTVDLSVKMTAPSESGSYTGNWQLRSPTGVIFGLGPNANRPFWVKINVARRQGRWDSDHPRDFAYNYCEAEWRSSTGLLPCPGSRADVTNGSITRTTSPVLEDGHQDDEPTLITIPNSGKGGFIQGRYPPLTVRDGDRFRTMVGCLDQSPKCDVSIFLDYSVDGGEVRNLGRWAEAYDGRWTRLDVDLSSLAGESVEFILRVNNNGDSTNDRVFWLVPAIVR